MANIFTLDNISDFTEKLNIDDLYESKRQHDLNTLALFNKILHRIHVRIRTTSKQRMHEQFCWFVVPEIIIGVPKYDQGSCIAYILDKLRENGFDVKYIHPNTMFISWAHWVPSYVRTELKKKTGIEVNEFGEKKVVDDIMKPDEKPDDVVKPKLNTNTRLFKPITSYKPAGII
jgi:hypothetical protein